MMRRTALALVVLVLICGCSTDEPPLESGLVATAGGTTARLSVPEGEAASVGTYVISITTGEAAPQASAAQINGERDGSPSGLWVDDVSGDGQADIIVSMTSAGSGSYGSCHVYVRSDEGFELRELAPLTDSQREGFLGHDAFRVTDGVIYRSFPVYASDDANARPSGGVLGYRYDFETDGWVEP